VKHPEKVDMVIFRENTEDIYAGIEYAAGTPERRRFSTSSPGIPQGVQEDPLRQREAAAQWQTQLEAIGAPKRETPVQVGVGLKPISYMGTERLVHSAIGYAVKLGLKSVTLVHKGNIMKFTEGRLPRLGLQGGKGLLRRSGDRRRPLVQDSRREAGRRHHHQGRHCRHHLAAGAHASRRIPRHRHPEFER
jgi:isocitrate dehydrogenase